MIKNSIYKILVDDSTLNGIVGSNIYPMLAPQDTDYPFIVIINNSTTPTDIKGAVSPNDEYFFQVDIYSSKQKECQTISARIRTLLDQYSGEPDDLNIGKIVFRDEQDSNFDIKVGVFAKSQEYNARIIR